MGRCCRGYLGIRLLGGAHCLPSGVLPREREGASPGLVLHWGLEEPGPSHALRMALPPLPPPLRPAGAGAGP